MSIKIVLADDHAIVRQGVRAVLEKLGKNMEVVAEIANGKDLVDYAAKTPADVYVVDISMPLLNGIEAIEEIAAGRFYLCSKVSKYIVQGFLGKTSARKRDSTGLTPKEKEVLQLIAEGYSSKQIAKTFNLSLNTIHVHRNNIMKKLGIHKQAELVRFALKEGIAQL